MFDLPLSDPLWNVAKDIKAEQVLGGESIREDPGPYYEVVRLTSP